MLFTVLSSMQNLSVNILDFAYIGRFHSPTLGVLFILLDKEKKFGASGLCTVLPQCRIFSKLEKEKYIF